MTYHNSLHPILLLVYLRLKFFIPLDLKPYSLDDGCF
nr:MAG TPA: hypothetical protein [Caudoviricetes sp.]DAX14725.1 MAG TPA: hypothetical protein [Bacteriophage sp.]DAX89659.1 MAG TPA: hypothetical protein [Caudoviricetes sp.]